MSMVVAQNVIYALGGKCGRIDFNHRGKGI